MPSALDAFRSMMRTDVAPGLRQLGFKGSGQSFELPSETHFVFLGFQKSTSSNSESVRFTVNVTAASRRSWEEARQRHDYLPERPSATTYYGTFAWQDRIGALLPDGEDRWWTVDGRHATAPVAADVLGVIRAHVPPAIRHG